MKRKLDSVDYGLLRYDAQGEETEIALSVWFNAYEGTPGTYWQPEELPEVDIVSITKEGTKEAFEVTEEEASEIENYILGVMEDNQRDEW